MKHKQIDPLFCTPDWGVYNYSQNQSAQQQFLAICPPYIEYSLGLHMEALFV
jgi:hypothetical protein